jgi:hypothetical protein
VTCGAWTGSFMGPGEDASPPPITAAVPEPGAAVVWLGGLAGLWTARRRRTSGKHGNEASGE